MNRTSEGLGGLDRANFEVRRRGLLFPEMEAAIVLITNRSGKRDTHSEGHPRGHQPEYD